MVQMHTQILKGRIANVVAKLKCSLWHHASLELAVRRNAFKKTSYINQMLNFTCQNIDLKCFKAFKPDCCNTSLQQNTAAWLTKGCDQASLVIFIFSFFTFLSTLLIFKGAILIHLTRLDSEGSGGELLKGSVHFNELVTSVPVYGSSSYIKLFTPTEQWRK